MRLDEKRTSLPMASSQGSSYATHGAPVWIWDFDPGEEVGHDAIEQRHVEPQELRDVDVDDGPAWLLFKGLHQPRGKENPLELGTCDHYFGREAIKASKMPAHSRLPTSWSVEIFTVKQN